MTPILDLSTLTRLRVRDAGAGNAWVIGMPRMLGSHAAAEMERMVIVDGLGRVFPKRSLWLSDLATDAPPHWKHLKPADVLDGAGDLDHGGWSLFFFPSDAATPVHPLDGLACDAASAALQLEQLGASAVVTSLVDDDEWLLVARGLQTRR
jgi:hypothetical protein